MEKYKTAKEKIVLYKSLYRGHGDDFISVMEDAGDIVRDYYDYLSHTDDGINCNEELKRLPTADYFLCCVLLTMLLREDHFSNGSFETRYRMGQVQPIVDRMILLLEEEDNERVKLYKQLPLFVKQKTTLDTFLSTGAISREQYLISLKGLLDKMGLMDPKDKYKCRKVMGEAISQRGLSNAKGVTLVNHAASFPTVEEREAFALAAVDTIINAKNITDILPSLGLKIQNVSGCDDWEEEMDSSGN